MRILTQRTVGMSCIFNLLTSMAYNTHIYYLSFYFQSALGTSAVVSGLRCLAYGIPGSIAILITGFCISAKGYYVPFMWVGTSIYIAGCVLLRTLNINSSLGQWLGYQILTGAGIGLAEQVPFIAVQVVLPPSDMPTACALVVFSRCLGGAVGLSIASNLFSGALIQHLKNTPGLNLNISAILAAGASDLSDKVPETLLPAVRRAFAGAVQRAFVMPIVVAGLGLVCSFWVQWRWIPDDRIKVTEGESQEGTETQGLEESSGEKAGVKH